MIVLLLLLAVVITSFLPLFFRKKIHEKLPQLNFSLRWLEWSSFSINFILLTTLIMASFNFYWRGFLSTSIILVITCFVTLLYYFYINKLSHFLGSFISLYLFFLISSTQLIIMYSIVTFNNRVFYDDSNYRIEDTFNGILAHQQLPKLFVKKNLLERKYIEEEGSPWKSLNKANYKSVEIKRKEGYFEVSFIMENDSLFVVKYIIK